MFEVYPMQVFEQPFVVKLHCERRSCPILCVSDRVPPFVMMSFDEACPILTQEDLDRFQSKDAEQPFCIPGSKVALRYYVALLCERFGCPIAINIKAPDVLVCIAISVKEYNRRVGIDAAVTEEDIAKAMKTLEWEMNDDV